MCEVITICFKDWTRTPQWRNVLWMNLCCCHQKNHRLMGWWCLLDIGKIRIEVLIVKLVCSQRATMSKGSTHCLPLLQRVAPVDS